MSEENFKTATFEEKLDILKSYEAKVIKKKYI